MSDTLQAAIEAHASGGPSLLALNVDEDDETLQDVLTYFDLAGADHLTAPELPAWTLVATDEDRCLGAVDIDDLAEYLFGATERASEDRPADLVTRVQGFMAALEGRVHTVDASERTPLIRVSRHLEQRAFSRGEGELHAGFQRLSRLADQPSTLEVYRRLAERGVEAHVYGIDDWDIPSSDGLHVHADPDGTVAGDYWFVVDDGGGDPAAGGALLTREIEPDVYRGFWTFQAEHVADILVRLDDVRAQL
ncbi:MAG: hypothetical protein ABEJ85_06015 [Haloarculaceae archaeon]